MKNPIYKYKEKKKKKKSGNSNKKGSSTAANAKLCKRRFLLNLMVKNDISPKGSKIVKGLGALSKLSNDLRKLHKEAIAIKNLEAHLYVNKDSKLIMDSVENVIHIVARYRKRMKDSPFCWRTNKIKYTNYWLRWISKEKSGKYTCKFPEEGLISPEFHRIPHVKGSETVKKVTDCSTFDELNRATVVPLVDPNAVLRNARMLLANDPNTNLPKENEEKIWTEFIKSDEETPDVDLLNSTSVEEEKKTIEVDHPIVSVIGNFAINTFNNACEMHVKKGEHNNLHDFEFVVCTYSKFGTAYHFYMTIEAIEEEYLGTYLAEVICNSSGGARTLCKFVLTSQEPLGTKALAVHYLSCLRTIYKTVDDLYNQKVIRLKTIQRRVTGLGRDLELDNASSDISRISRLRDETMKSLHQRLCQDTESLFPPDCNRTTRQDGWSDPDKGQNSGMVRRAEGTTCSGYDFYNLFLTGSGN